MTNTPPKVTTQNQFRALTTNLSKVVLAGPWVLNGKSYTKAQFAKVFQDSITSTDAATAAQALATQAVKKARTDRETARGLRALFLTLLELNLGPDSPVIAQLGYTAPRAPLTLEVKTAAKVKAQATRTARHTMGTNQKKRVKGNTASAPVVSTSLPTDPAVVSTTPMVPLVSAPEVAAKVGP